MNITAPLYHDALARALQSGDRENWIPGQPGNSHAAELYDVARQYGLDSPEYQQALSQADAAFKAGPGGIMGVLNKISVPASVAIGTAVTGGALGLGPLAGGGAGVGANSLPPSAGALPAAPSVGAGLGGIGGAISKYGPLALGAAGAISSAQQSSKASHYLDSAIQSSQGDYNARQPLRTAGIANLSALPNLQQIQTQLGSPSNPFNRSLLPPAPANSYRVNDTPRPRPALSIGPNGLPLPPRGA